MGVLTIISLIIAIVAIIRVKDQEKALQALKKKVEQLQQLATQNKLSADINAQPFSPTQAISQTRFQNGLQNSSQENSPPIAPTIFPENLPENGQLSAKQLPQLSADISPPFSPDISPKTLSQAPDESSPSVVTSLLASAKNWFFGENLIVRVGALVLLVGVVLLLKLASQYIHVSIANRMLAVAVAGLVTIAIGYRTAHNPKRERKSYGLTLQGVGFAMIYLTVFASFRLYHLLPSNLTFAVLAVVAGVTVLLSVKQNALPLAVLAFGGAFFAPILVGNPQGSVVLLFSYYLLLNVAVAVIAHFRTWKLLNALSLFVTFGLAYVWGFGQYVASQAVANSLGETGLSHNVSVFAQTRWQLLAILLAHIALYLFIAIRYSQQVVAMNVANAKNFPVEQRQNIDFQGEKATAKSRLRPLLSIDAGLLLGTAILGFGLLSALLHDLPFALAVSSGVLAVVYLGLGFWLLKLSQKSPKALPMTQNSRFERFYNSYQLLIETTLALGVAFLVLVIPLALSAHWVSVGWAIQGASLVWLGQRTARQWTVWFGLALQAVTAWLVLDFYTAQATWYAILDNWHIAHALPVMEFSANLPLWILTLALGLSAFVLRFGVVKPPFTLPKFVFQQNNINRFSPLQPLAKKSEKTPSTSGLAIALVVATGFFYLDSVYHWVKNSHDEALDITLALTMALSAVLLAGQWVHERYDWRALRQVSRAVLPLAMALWTMVWFAWSPIERVFDSENMISVGLQGLAKGLLGLVAVLAVAKLVGVWLLSRWYKEGVKTAADQLVWLLTLVVMATTMLASIHFASGELSNILLILPSVLAGLGLVGLQVGSNILFKNHAIPMRRWRYWLDSKQLLRDSGLFLIPAMGLWLMMANATESGQLLGFYLPLLNPLDITLLAILAYLGYQGFFAKLNNTNVQAVFAVALFWTVSSLLVRSFASVLGTPIWNDGAWQVGEVQTGLTILWSIVAMGLMFFASKFVQKRGVRVLWFAGVSLLGLVVVKLVMVDMSHTSAILRVVSFIGAGVLMLVIGYLAPLPPVRVGEKDEIEKI